MLPRSVFTSLRVSMKVYGSEEPADAVVILKCLYVKTIKATAKSKSTAPASNVFHVRRAGRFETDKMLDVTDVEKVSSASAESEALRESASKLHLSERAFIFARVSVGDNRSSQDTFKIWLMLRM